MACTTRRSFPTAIRCGAWWAAMRSRTGTSVYHQQPTYQGTMNVERSAYVLYDTPDPDVFIAEIDVAFD